MSENLSCRPRELHSRTDAGIQVSLWWSPAGERARDVFDHPYAYAARRVAAAPHPWRKP